jgi:hypothetical protein
MKFKVGDKVVVARDTLGYRMYATPDSPLAVGFIDVVIDPIPFDEDNWITLDRVNAPEADLELEAVYNSPLYKALR